ncbi:hypothetical protein Anapl_00354 [Anas platyrhynchos]|uniref:Uncharacterized protein n=1 Tax=Anas platyrhynchos TaxID=8839 RepID=R0JV03_ANAPL|nr:hypothetical protein Anapl_00354 [Anas platyrhynchos]
MLRAVARDGSRSKNRPPSAPRCPLQCPKACPLPEEGQQEGKAPFSGLAGGRQEGPSLRALANGAVPLPGKDSVFLRAEFLQLNKAPHTSTAHTILLSRDQ